MTEVTEEVTEGSDRGGWHRRSGSNSGLQRFANFNNVTPVTFIRTDPSGAPVYSLANFVTDPANNSKFQTHNLNSRWKMKLGIRWTF